jgi:dephospho-CoA kinase
MRIYLAGPAGTGKTTAANILDVQFGFRPHHLSDVLRSRGHRRDRAWLQAYGDRLRATFGDAVLAMITHQAVVCEEILTGAGIDAVIDGVRLPEEAGYLRAQGYRGLRIEAPEDLRRARLAAGGRSLAGPEAEHPTEQAAGDVPADLTIQNAGDLRGLTFALEQALRRLRTGG